jgi:HlyD family secretion protein
VINVPNEDLRLMPGMTANLSVKTQEALNVMKIPSAALRFWPPQEYFDRHIKEYPDSVQKMIERAQKYMARRQSGQSGSGSQPGSGTQGGSGGQMAATAQQGQGNQQGSGMRGQNGSQGSSQQGTGALNQSGRQGGSGGFGQNATQNAGGQGNVKGQGWGSQGGMHQRMGMVWVKQGNLIMPRRVRTGISDNSYTEVEGSIKEGDELVTGIVNTNSGQQTTQQQSPFAPQMGRPQQPPAGGARGGR